MTWVSAMSVGVCEKTEYGMSGSKSDVRENTEYEITRVHRDDDEMTWVSAMSVGACENTEYGMSGNTSDGSE